MLEVEEALACLTADFEQVVDAGRRSVRELGQIEDGQRIREDLLRALVVPAFERAVRLRHRFACEERRLAHDPVLEVLARGRERRIQSDLFGDRDRAHREERLAGFGRLHIEARRSVQHLQRVHTEHLARIGHAGLLVEAGRDLLGLRFGVARSRRALESLREQAQLVATLVGSHRALQQLEQRDFRGRFEELDLLVVLVFRRSRRRRFRLRRVYDQFRLRSSGLIVVPRDGGLHRHRRETRPTVEPPPSAAGREEEQDERCCDRAFRLRFAGGVPAARAQRFDLARELVRAADARARVLLHQATDEIDHAVGQVRDVLAHRFRLVLQERPHDLACVLAFERRVTGQQSIRRGAERVEVGAVVDFLAARLLRRHEVRCAEHLPVGRLRFFGLDVRRQTEVGDFRLTDVILHQVRGLQIAVHDPLRLGEHESGSGVAQDREHFVDGQTPGFRDAVLERAALHELHGEEVRALVLADVVDRDDVRMVQGRGGARFGLETAYELGVRGEACAEDFDGDAAVEARLYGEVDLAHSAATDALLEAEAGDRRERGRLGRDGFGERCGGRGRVGRSGSTGSTGAHRRKRRCEWVRHPEHDLTEPQLVARLQLRDLDARAVHERAALRPEILDRPTPGLRTADRAVNVRDACTFDDEADMRRIAADDERPGARQFRRRATGKFEEETFAHAAPSAFSNSVEPTRTIVAPSSIAISKSPLMPRESSGSCAKAARFSRAKSAARRNTSRASSA